MLTHFKIGFNIDFQCLVTCNNEKYDKKSVTKFHVRKLSGKYKAPIGLPTTDKGSGHTKANLFNIRKALLFLPGSRVFICMDVT